MIIIIKKLKIDFPLHYIFNQLVSNLMKYFEVSREDVNEQISLFSKLKQNKDVVTGTDELAIELLNLSDSDASLTEFIEAPKNLNEWNALIDDILTKLFHFNIGFGNETQKQMRYFINNNNNNNTKLNNGKNKKNKGQSIFITLILSLHRILMIRGFGGGLDFNTTDEKLIVAELVLLFIFKLFKELVSMDQLYQN